MCEQEDAAGRRHTFVWYAEDDVLLTGPWHELMQAQDLAFPSVDLLTAQDTYLLAPPSNPSWISTTELAIARGGTPLPADANRQLVYPSSNLQSRLGFPNNSSYAKAVLFMWRMSGRLATSLAQQLSRGLRAHEEFLVPTICLASLNTPACSMRALPAAVKGVPCGANSEDAWNKAQQQAHTAELRVGIATDNHSEFKRVFLSLQQGNGASVLAKNPARLYHPVKGQLQQPKGLLGTG